MDERGVGPSHSCRAPPAGPPRVHSRQVPKDPRVHMDPALAATKCSYHITWKPNRLWSQSAIVTTSQHSSHCCVLVDPNTTYSPHRGQASPPQTSSTAAIAANENNSAAHACCTKKQSCRTPVRGWDKGGGCNACQRHSDSRNFTESAHAGSFRNRACRD